MQPEELGPLPEAVERALARRSGSVGSEASGGSTVMGEDGTDDGGREAGLSALRVGVEDPEERKYRGRIEAVKLTGDPNIPRGEYTFIAPDISRDGLLRVAQEEIFKGARVVWCAGHIAAGGFREGMSVKSNSSFSFLFPFPSPFNSHVKTPFVLQCRSFKRYLWFQNVG